LGKVHYSDALIYIVSIRRILTPVTGKPDVLDLMLKSLKVDSDLPASAQTQSADISNRVDEVMRRLRPDLLDDLFTAIEKGSLSQSLAAGLIPELSSLLESGLQEILKEENRFSSLTQRVQEAYRRVVEVQTPMAEFLTQRLPQQDAELAERVNELKRFREALESQRVSLDKLGEKIGLAKQRLVKLREQVARLGSQAPTAQLGQPNPPQSSLPP
jgi:chromosome segregation ATPase